MTPRAVVPPYDQDTMTSQTKDSLVRDARVLIVGCGRMGQTRAVACRRLGAHIEAVLDVDSSAAHALARECEAGSVLDDLAQVDWAQLEAAIVSTPPADRVPAVLAALRAGVPVLMEKPVGPSASAVHEIIAQLKSRPAVTAVGYMNRYRRSVLQLREDLRGKAVFAVVCKWVAPPYEKPWWHDDAGPLRDYATHLVDLCRFLVGDIAEVAATVTRERDNGRLGESAALSLGFAGGACGSLFTSSLGEEKHISFDVFFDGGTATLEGWDLRRGGDAEEPEDGAMVFERETQAFLAAACGAIGSAPLCDFHDALQTQLVVDAAYSAARTGETQRLHS
jgi:myo-inositol 2-dehydrogenase/D-chiro-inositol 1-dehydrogenase